MNPQRDTHFCGSQKSREKRGLRRRLAAQEGRATPRGRRWITHAPPRRGIYRVSERHQKPCRKPTAGFCAPQISAPDCPLRGRMRERLAEKRRTQKVVTLLGSTHACRLLSYAKSLRFGPTSAPCNALHSTPGKELVRPRPRPRDVATCLRQPQRWMGLEGGRKVRPPV